MRTRHRYLPYEPDTRTFFLVLSSLLFACSSGYFRKLPAQETFADEPFRQWTSTAGTTVSARLVKSEHESISLILKGEANPRSIPLDKLQPADRRYVAQRLFDAQDRRQFELVKSHLRSVNERPQTVSRLLIQIHNEFPHSPYAGLWAAVTLSAGSNEYGQARVILENTIRRIKRQQELDESRHRMTLCSANNNLAICLIKSRKGDSAATRMTEAIESLDRLPPVIRSNAELLNELTQDGGSPITFSPSIRTRLMRSIALAETPGSGTKLPDGWHYTLDFDAPSESSGALKIDGIDAPIDGLQLLASGSGFVVAPGIVLTARPVIETTDYRGPKLVTVITDAASSMRKSELVRDLLVASTQSYAVHGSVGTSEAFSDTTWTNYNYVRPQNGQLGAEIAALRVPNLSLPPVQVARDDPSKDTQIRILGFARGQAGLDRGLQIESGKILRPRTIAGMFSVAGQTGRCVTLETSARVMGGNRGGPVVDDRNQVVGIAYDTPVSGSDSRGMIFGSGEFLRWFFDHVQTASPTSPNPESTAEERFNQVSNSTVAVFCWGPRQKSSSRLFSEFTDGSRDSGGIYLKDHWCLACDGKGFIGCPVRGCNKGVVAGRRTVDGPINPITGKRTKVQTVTRGRCSTCAGAGGKKCPHCDGGRI
tara:strand:+ start:576077 stop:578032 length:1956 start_codon:yes stop_codon:yes gene_type:complete